MEVISNPADGGSFLLMISPAGSEESHRLPQFSLARFAQFVNDWEPVEVRIRTALLERLPTCMG